MARYIRPVCRLCRRSGEKLMLKGDKCIGNCTFDKRPRPPGPRPARARRLSDRGVQLREKQKARYSYGMMERQFRRFFGIAERQQGVTGENLVVILERRMDNVIYRLGYGDSRAQARQLVQHGHFKVNGKRTDIPSFLLKEGDIISWTEGGAKTEYYKLLLETIKGKTVPNWLSLDREQLTGRVLSLPTIDDIPDIKFSPQVIVEYYSR
ncbi:30S ribosomal protein S4 [Chloroflexota bacterium]